jgi:hypothetical protein
MLMNMDDRNGQFLYVVVMKQRIPHLLVQNEMERFS